MQNISDATATELAERVRVFQDEFVSPSEDSYLAGGESQMLAMARLRSEARTRDLWNLCLSGTEWGRGLTNLQYAPIAELTGRTLGGAEALNCDGPDSVNMETLLTFGTSEQKEVWLRPLAEGSVRSCFAMTEPDVASSDASNIATSFTRKGNEFVISGRKWWSSGAAHPECAFALTMGVSGPDESRYHRHSILIVPMDSPGVTIARELTAFGYGHGAAEIIFDEVVVPAENLLGGEGSGFAVAQSRLGPARIQHCMRLIGMAERALGMMCARARVRRTFGVDLVDRETVRDWIAESRLRIEQARLLVLATAKHVDENGVRDARRDISLIKVAVPRMACWILDRAIQVHGAAGVTDDLPLATMYVRARTLQIADGPDEVHNMVIARSELGKSTTSPAIS